MAPDPEQVHVIHRIAAAVIGEKVHPECAVQRQHGGDDRQRRKGEHHQDAGAKGGPDKHRHLHQPHPRCAFAQDRGDKVDPGHRGADATDQDGPDPVVHADTGAEFDPRIGRIPGPSGGREPTDHQRDQHQPRARPGQPEADRIEQRKRHVPRADLQGHHDIDQPGQERHRHEKDHDCPVRTEDLLKMLGRQKAAVVQRQCLLQAHHDRVNKAAQQHDQGQHYIHHADPLVVEAGDPLCPKIPPCAQPGHDAKHRDGRTHGDSGPRDGHRGIERQRVKGQTTEKRPVHHCCIPSMDECSAGAWSARIDSKTDGGAG